MNTTRGPTSRRVGAHSSAMPTAPLHSLRSSEEPSSSSGPPPGTRTEAGPGRILLGKRHAFSALLFHQKPALRLGFENLSTTFVPSVCDSASWHPPFLPSGLKTLNKPPRAGDVYCHHPKNQLRPPPRLTSSRRPRCAAVFSTRSTAPPGGCRERLLRMRAAGRRLGPLGAS